MPIDPFVKTGWQSNKVFWLLNGATEEAREIGELATNVGAPAQDDHITPGITETFLLSTAKFADAGYTTIFDGNQVNIYDQHNTVITVSRAAIIQDKRVILEPTCSHRTQQHHQNKASTTRKAATTGHGFQCLQAENSTRTGAIPPRLRQFPNQAGVAPCSQEQAVRY